MALSGKVNGSVTNLSAYFSFYFEWSAVQSIPGNYSDITVTTYWKTSNTSRTFDTSSKRNASITIGDSVDSISQRFACNPWPSGGIYQIQTSTVRVPHNDDGTLSVTISARANGTASSYGPSSSTSASGDCVASATITLDAIPRYAMLTSAPSFTDTDNPAIGYSNPLGAAVSSLEACISLDGTTATVAYRPLLLNGASYTFVLTEAERTALRTATVLSREVTFIVKTVYLDVTYYSKLTRTFTVTESADTRPTVSVSVSPNNGSLPSTFDGIYIQSKSKVDVSVTAEAKYGATVDHFATVVEGVTYDAPVFTSNVLSGSGDLAITTTVSDSRGFSARPSNLPTINVLSYARPSVVPNNGESEIMCYRSDPQGNAMPTSVRLWLKATKKCTSLNGLNTSRMMFRFKASTDEWDNQQWIALSLAGDVMNGMLVGVFAITVAYTVQVKVVDTIGEEAIVSFDVPTDDVPLHLGKYGKSVGIGRYADIAAEHSVKVGWATTFDDSVTFAGATFPDATKGGKYLKLNTAGTALEWGTPSGGGGGGESYDDTELRGLIAGKADINHTHSQYLTQHQSLAGYAKTEDIPTVPTVVSAFTNDSGYLTEHQSLAGYAKSSEIPTDAHINSLIDAAIGEYTIILGGLL